MTIWRRLILTLALLITASTACANDPIQWTVLDGGLDRSDLLNAYVVRITQPKDPSLVYREGLRYLAAADSLGVDDWSSLNPAQQQYRQELAEPYRQQVQSTHRTLSHARNVAMDPSLSTRGHGLISGGGTLLIETLGALVNLTGLVPVEAAAWFDLAYMAGCIGDTRRQEAALLTFNDLYEDGAPDQRKQWRDRRVRSSLDLGWLARDRGAFDEAMAWALDADVIMDNAGGGSPANTREARLIAALVRAEQGEFDEARSLAAPLTDLPFWKYNKVMANIQSFTDTKLWAMQIQYGDTARINWTDHTTSTLPTQKNAWGREVGPWARHWVRALVAMKQGDEKRTFDALGNMDPFVEYPAHLSYRLWNDRGRVCDAFNRHEQAQRCYAQATLYRPFFIYYPLEGRRSLSRYYTDHGGNQVFFLGAGYFYTAGDQFAHATACLLAYELETDAEDRNFLKALADDALTACRNRGTEPTAALALRGRLNFLTGDLTRAEVDLTTAHRELQAQNAVDPEVVFILGLVHFNSGDYSGAVPWLERYRRLEPENALGWQALGLAAVHIGQLDAAATALGRATALKPEDPNAWFNKALVEIQRGDRATAQADLAHAQALLPDHPDIARVAEAIAEGPLPDLTVDASPIVLQADATSRAQAKALAYQRVHLLGALGGDEGMEAAVADTASLASLEHACLMDPNLANRVRLAARHELEGRPAEVRQLLASTWQDDQDYTAMMLLLRADRALGDVQRAKVLVHGRQTVASNLDQFELWLLVGAICRENGQAELGRVAGDRADDLLTADR